METTGSSRGQSDFGIGDDNPPDIDEDLHRQQLSVSGREITSGLLASNILIQGMEGLGAEIAKNLILAGVKSVKLYDEGMVKLRDLSSNFVLSDTDVGKNRALACVEKLQDLNKEVHVSAMTNQLSKEQLSEFEAVVFTDISLEKAFEFNDYCHNHQPAIAFVKTEVRGLFGYVFWDFGPEFTVDNVDGEEPEKGGTVTQVKQPEILKFKPLREALRDPGDFDKFDRPSLLHLAFQALDRFVYELGRYPVAGSEEDAQKLFSTSADINQTLEDGKVKFIDPEVLQHFSFGASAVLNPMAAMFGGIAGHAVIKACSKKFHPLNQFFYFDSLESLPDPQQLDPSDFAPLDSRYDSQISVFGSKLQKKLEDARVFLVGSGDLGCEFLKNLALMGVSCGKDGKLTVTDDDMIEKNNLSSQFLFRDGDIGQAKSTVAATSAESINPQLRVEALQNRVGPDTENVFDDNYWEKLSIVINTLDNVNASRLYVKERCLHFQKPLLESGELGAKCKTQTVIPHMTDNYGSLKDPSEKQAPMCTVTATGLFCLELYKILDNTLANQASPPPPVAVPPSPQASPPPPVAVPPSPQASPPPPVAVPPSPQASPPPPVAVPPSPQASPDSYSLTYPALEEAKRKETRRERSARVNQQQPLPRFPILPLLHSPPLAPKGSSYRDVVGKITEAPPPNVTSVSRLRADAPPLLPNSYLTLEYLSSLKPEKLPKVLRRGNYLSGVNPTVCFNYF